MSTPATVEARFAEDGDIAILSFTWQGRALPVTGMGRRWDENGAAHFLVMTLGERIFELIFERAAGKWTVSETSPKKAAA